MGIGFRTIEHQEAFEELLEQTYLGKEELMEANELLRRQLAFFYIISYYKKQYREYEGVEFWVDCGETLSLDGPTYLLGEEITNYTYAHEQVLKYGKQILKGEINIHIKENDEVMYSLVEDALQIAIGGISEIEGCA